MDSWHEAQNEIYQALTADKTRCFLRVCATPDALWVSDYPRRCRDIGVIQARLKTLRVRCWAGQDHLLRLDLETERYQALAEALPVELPPLPRSGALHEAYALCRLLLLHPAPVSEQPMEAVREGLKLPHKCADERSGVIQRLFAQCAVWMRTDQPLPAMVGGVLADWLNQLEGGAHT